MFLLACVLVASLSGVGQQRPDFSGSWVAISPPEAAGHEQVVTQDAAKLTTGHDSEGGPHSHVFTYELDGTEVRRVLRSHGEDIVTFATASWDGAKLVIQERTTYPDGRKRGQRSVWSLNERRELEIDTVEQFEGQPQITRKVVFRRIR